MKRKRFFSGIAVIAMTVSSASAQTLTPAFNAAGGLPAEQGWQERRFDRSMHSGNESVAEAAMLAAAVENGALRLQSQDDARLSQLVWALPSTGFHPDVGYTVEFRAKVTSNGGAFTVQGIDRTGKGFRIAVTDNAVMQNSVSTAPPAAVGGTADNTDGFHTYRIAVAAGGTVHVYRDGVEIGQFPLAAHTGDNWILNGGFESGAAGAAPQGWTAGSNGSATKETGSHAHYGNGGYYVNEGGNYNYEVPLKPFARYDFSFWAKSIVNDGDKYRDVEGWLNPAGLRPINGYPSRGAAGTWLKYGGDGNGQWDNVTNNDENRNFKMSVAGSEAAKTFSVKIVSNNNMNVTDFDDITLAERIIPSRVPATAVNLFPNGDFEDETLIRDGDYTAGADDDNSYVANFTGNGSPDWHQLWKCRVRLEKGRGAGSEAGVYWSHGGKYALRYFGRERVTTYGVQDDGVWEGRGQNTDMDYEQELEVGKTYTFSFWYKSFRWGDHIRFRVQNGSEVVWRNDNISNDKFPFWENAVVTFTTTAANHTLRLRTEQYGGDPGAVYLDDLFLFEGYPLPAFDGSYIQFGKSIGAAACDVQISNVSFSASGAYAPDGTPFPAQWRMKQAPLMTQWSEGITDEADITDNLLFADAYPRPQMERTAWHNLNGVWNFARSETREGLGQYSAFGAYPLKILVPYPIESAISGIMDADYSNTNKIYAYRRTFDPADGKRVLLHFGAVDWEAHVFVNGTKVGDHNGGFDPFSFDITSHLNPHGTPDEIVVQIWDPTAAGNPAGKQTTSPSGIWYTPSSGIWQTVWYEELDNGAHITGLDITPDVDGSAVKVRVNAQGAGALTAEVKVLSAEGSVLSTETIDANTLQPITIASPHLWTPDNPYLYRLQIVLKQGGAEKDAVKSYFGMRKIALGTLRGKPFITLNDEPIFNFGTLDQGYFPDGLHTSPGYAALKFDIEKTKELGFNMIRKHIKTEPARWYYYCDSIGMMVWQDMPTPYDDDLSSNGNMLCSHALASDGVCALNGGNSDEAVRANFLRESEQIVRKFAHFPSIVVWIPYNEGWGQYGTGPVGLQHTRNGVNLIRSLDNTRLINPVSGWHQYENAGYDMVGGDILDMHNYSEPNLWDNPSNRRANVCGETGGYGFGIQNHIWGGVNNPYGLITQEQFLSRLRNFGNIAFANTAKGINGIVYTQITDVEEELNGLWTYDRKVCKLPDSTKAVLMQVIDTMKRWAQAAQYILPTAAQQRGQIWKYRAGNASFTPGDGWQNVGYDDSQWSQGTAGFGDGNPPGSKISTAWNSQTIYLRRMVEIPALTDEQKDNLCLSVYYDEDFKVYINGVLAAQRTGYSTAYVSVEISAEARAAIIYGGSNLVAVQCKQTIGGQYIDVGIAAVQVVALGQEVAMTEPPAAAVTDIYTAEQFNAIRNNLYGVYRLQNNIDLSDYANWQPIGTLAEPFRGTLLGNNKTISGMTSIAAQTNADANKRKGLFGYAVGAVFTDFELRQPTVIGHSDIGALLGKGAMVSIERVDVVKPHISGVDHVGGMAGGTDAGVISHIKDCYIAQASVITSASQAGGVLGVAKNTRIENTYFTGTITAPRQGTHNNAGGIIGLSEADNNSLSGVASLAAEITGGTTGEFAARGQTLVEISNTFARSDMSLSDYIASSDIGLGRATATQQRTLEQMQTQATYEAMGWSFGAQGIWKMSIHTGFPIFAYQTDAALPDKYRQRIVWEQTLPTAIGAGIALTAEASSALPVSYTSSNTAVALISGNTLSIVGAGSAVITASQSGDAHWAVAAQVQKTLTIAASTAVSDDVALTFVIFPNPVVSGEFLINGSQITADRVEVYAMNGALLKTFDVQSASDAVINISSFPSGIYIVKTGSKSAKIVKK